MRSTGIVRRIDQLGRVTIPMETRNILGIKVNDSLEIFTEDNMIILKKYQPCCIFCGNARDVMTFQQIVRYIENGKCRMRDAYGIFVIYPANIRRSPARRSFRRPSPK